MREVFNTDNRDHQTLFGADAFYDLDQVGAQSAALSKVHVGEKYLVLRRERELLRFDWWLCRGIRLMPNPTSPGVSVNVLYGNHLPDHTEVLSQEDAFKKPLYRNFFNKNGGLKRGVTIL